MKWILRWQRIGRSKTWIQLSLPPMDRDDEGPPAEEKRPAGEAGQSDSGENGHRCPSSFFDQIRNSLEGQA